MLKSPNKTISLFFSASRFSIRVFKNRLLNWFTSIDGWRNHIPLGSFFCLNWLFQWNNQLVQTIQNHLDSSFFSSVQKCACLIHYISFVTIYHICYIGLNQNHKKLFYYILYMESVLPCSRLVKEDKGKSWLREN